MYYQENKDNIRKTQKIYNSKPEIRKKTNEKNRLRLEKDVDYKTRHKFRNLIRDTLTGRRKCKNILEIVGCTTEELITYFKSLFTVGMTWEKFKDGDIHVDHIIPCSKFDLSLPEAQAVCFHYTNLQPLWKPDDIRKSNKITPEDLKFILEKGIAKKTINS